VSLSRLFPTIGSLIIRNIGDVGGPPSDRVSQELDSLITGVNDISAGTTRIIGVPYTLPGGVITSTVGNVGGGLKNLHSFSLPAGSLAANSDYLDLFFAGSFASNDNDKQVNITMDGQNIMDIGGVIDIDNLFWTARLRVVRLSATTVRAYSDNTWSQIRVNGGVLDGFANGAIVFVNRQAPTVSNLNSNAVTIQVRGEGTANNDVVQDLSIVQLVRMS
jgi:hypothetical protein